MKAIQIVREGAEARLEIGEAERPRPTAGEVLIDVEATAINRADLLQRRGLYPPPPGASKILGLECSGTIAELGERVDGWSVGDRVCALLAGGGYAEAVAVDAGSVMRVPAAMELAAAAAVPEVFLTCSLNLFQIGAVAAGDWVLVHGGGSGIGTAAIQLLRAAGARTIVTAGSDDKCARCVDLGASAAINYRQGEFADRVLELTAGEGVTVVLDSIGAPYLAQHLRCLALGGRLLLIGLMGGASADLDLGLVLRKRLALHGSTLRARPVEEKAEIVAAFLRRFGLALEDGSIGPTVHETLPLAEAQKAHDILEESSHFGKVVLVT